MLKQNSDMTGFPDDKQVPDLCYYSEKPALKIPEYGRTVQQMVDHCLTIQDREIRNRAARAVIEVMGEINPHLRNVPDFQHKLWDQLLIMSDFRLDIDSPFPIPEPETFSVAPEKLDYPEILSTYRYYGHNIRKMIEVALSWEEGEKRDALVMAVARHMKKCYLAWNKDTVDDEVIMSHLAELSDGKIDLGAKNKSLASHPSQADVQRKKFIAPPSRNMPYRQNNNQTTNKFFNNQTKRGSQQG